MDFAKYAPLSSDNTYPLALYAPDGKPEIGNDGLAIQLFLLPPYSAELKKREEKLNAEVRADRANSGNLSDAKAEEYNLRRVCLPIDGWTSNWDLEGEALEYTPGNAVKFLRAVPHVREMIAAAGKDKRIAWLGISLMQEAGVSGEEVSTEETPKAAPAAKKNTARSRKAGSKASGKSQSAS